MYIYVTRPEKFCQDGAPLSSLRGPISQTTMPRCLVLVACLVAGAASFGAAPAIVVQRLPRKPPSRRLAVPRVCATAEEELDERLPPVGQQLQLFWRLSKPFFEQCEGAKLALALLIGLTLLNSGVAVLFSYAS